jgi:hypothetical protein
VSSYKRDGHQDSGADIVGHNDLNETYQAILNPSEYHHKTRRKHIVSEPSCFSGGTNKLEVKNRLTSVLSNVRPALMKRPNN